MICFGDTTLLILTLPFATWFTLVIVIIIVLLKVCEFSGKFRHKLVVYFGKLAARAYTLCVAINGGRVCISIMAAF